MTASFRSEGFENTTSRQYCWIAVFDFCSIVVEQYFLRLQIQRNGFLRHNGGLLRFPVRQMSVHGSFFAACGATDILLLLGSRIAALCLIVVLEFTPLFGLIHQLVQRSDFTVLIVSANIAVLLMAVLSILSFDVDRILSHLWVIII